MVKPPYPVMAEVTASLNGSDKVVPETEIVRGVEIAGGVVSYVTVNISVPVFGIASLPEMVMVLTPNCKGMLAMLQLFVPAVPSQVTHVAVPLPPVALLLHVTLVTPTASEAVPASVTVLDDVE